MNIVRLKAELRRRLTDKSQYPGERLTLRMVMERAAEIALTTVDELAAPAPAPERRRPGQGSPTSGRLQAAQEKRERILRVLRNAEGPMRAGHICREALLTPGECSYLLKTTPGVASVGRGLYALAAEGQSHA